MIQSGKFLCTLLGPLLKTGLPLTKNVIKALAKIVLISLGLTAAADAGSDRRLDCASHNATLIISNYEIEYITKIVKHAEDSDLLW